ncbi:hypothetical protein BD410DRAFT_304051 [Rickenella mellea]|uniref:DUF6533 domain-containing protein n=1 Tax=Rickenella mellea TaxID=50990 RepID=A0A4Y7Q194_9AGAM|nr:hypothetical protein BD410DRAFT_304051 [Rickenella mellea]
MSDSSVIAELTAQASQLQYLNSVIVSGAALVFYDYALTLSTEISEIWNSKLSGAQALFFLSRYGFMVYTVVYCTDSLTPNPSETMSSDVLQCTDCDHCVRNRIIWHSDFANICDISEKSTYFNDGGVECWDSRDSCSLSGNYSKTGSWQQCFRDHLRRRTIDPFPSK